jgi:hypothetical protein
MRQSKFTETRIVSILKEDDAGRPVNEIWREYGSARRPSTGGRPNKGTGGLRREAAAAYGRLAP